MLTQMGYKKGQGLGKNRDGREEPIDLMIKDKKTGLGMDEERKRKREEAEKAQALRGTPPPFRFSNSPCLFRVASECFGKSSQSSM